MALLLEKRVHPALVAVALALVVAAMVAGEARVQAGQVNGDAPASLDEVQCPEGDLVYSVTREFLPGDQRGRSSSVARDELARFFRARYPRGNPDRFAIASQSDRETRFVMEGAAGEAVAAAHVTRDEAGWALRSFSACNSYLQTVGDPASSRG